MDHNDNNNFNNYLSGKVQYHDQRTPGGPQITDNNYSVSSSTTSNYQPKTSSTYQNPSFAETQYHGQKIGTEFPETGYQTGVPYASDYSSQGYEISNRGVNYGTSSYQYTPSAATGPSGFATQTPVYQNQKQVMGQNQVKGPQYDDRDRTNDLLSTEKYLSSGYNISLNEMVNPQLHQTIKNILNDTHEYEHHLFQTMMKKGWYQVSPAQQQEVDKARQKFTNYESQFPF
ncbi:MAG: spore coat protein [Halanaerobium sp.]|nr:spore coat protein [Halanaerobium sp.]